MNDFEGLLQPRLQQHSVSTLMPWAGGGVGPTMSTVSARSIPFVWTGVSIIPLDYLSERLFRHWMPRGNE